MLRSKLSDLTRCGIPPFEFAGFHWPRHVATLEHLAKYREAMNNVSDAVRELRAARRDLADATQAYERG